MRDENVQTESRGWECTRKGLQQHGLRDRGEDNSVVSNLNPVGLGTTGTELINMYVFGIKVYSRVKTPRFV